jgi:SAM-dependent methyltransferase
VPSDQPDHATVGDAWGQALLDHLHDRPLGLLELEVDDGAVVRAMEPEWFFRGEAHWAPAERHLMGLVAEGPVLDLGAGAGRAALHLQDRGFSVTAVESSPGAAAVCRERGLVDVRVRDLVHPPSDQPWGTVLLLCGNLGLGGSWEGNRRLLRSLAAVCAPGALLVGDSVDDQSGADLRLRLRYDGLVGPWWCQRNVAVSEAGALVDGTGWIIEHHLQAAGDHHLALRRA